MTDLGPHPIKVLVEICVGTLVNCLFIIAIWGLIDSNPYHAPKSSKTCLIPITYQQDLDGADNKGPTVDDYLASIESNLDTNCFQGDEQILQQTVFSFSTPLHVPGGGARDSFCCIGPASRLQFFQSF